MGCQMAMKPQVVPILAVMARGTACTKIAKQMRTTSTCMHRSYFAVFGVAHVEMPLPVPLHTQALAQATQLLQCYEFITVMLAWKTTQLLPRFELMTETPKTSLAFYRCISFLFCRKLW